MAFCSMILIPMRIFLWHFKKMLHGRLELFPMDLLYEPTPGFFGTDSFTYVANDGEFDSNLAKVTIEVYHGESGSGSE